MSVSKTDTALEAEFVALVEGNGWNVGNEVRLYWVPSELAYWDGEVYAYTHFLALSSCPERTYGEIADLAPHSVSAALAAAFLGPDTIASASVGAFSANSEGDRVGSIIEDFEGATFDEALAALGYVEA